MILNARTLKRKMFGVNNFHASKEAQWSNAVVLRSAFYLMGADISEQICDIYWVKLNQIYI